MDWTTARFLFLFLPVCASPMAIIELVSVDRSGIYLKVSTNLLLKVIEKMLFIHNEQWWYFGISVLAANILLAARQKRKTLCRTIIKPSLYYKILIFRDEVFGTADISSANNYYQLGILKKSRGRCDDAIYYFREAEDILRVLRCSREMKDPHLLTSIVACSVQIALTLGELGYYTKAHDYFEKAIFKIERAYGKNHATIAYILNNMAIMLKNNSQFKRSLKCHSRALSIFKLLGDDASTGITYSNLSLLHARMGKWKEALACNRKALNLKLNDGSTRTDFQENRSIAINYNSQGLIFQGMGNLDEALRCHLLAVKIKEQMLDRDILSLALSYFNVSAIYAEKSEYEEALRYSEKSKLMREALLGENHYLSKRSQDQIDQIRNK